MPEAEDEIVDVRSLREELGLSQPEFAARFGLALGTLRQWEHGRRRPDGAARTLLRVIAIDPDEVERAIEADRRRARQPRKAQ